MSQIDPSKIEQPFAHQPTVSGFYADPKLKPVSLFKAVRAAKIKAFQTGDLEAARAAVGEKDPELSRTLALGLATRPPEAVERWVIEVTRSAVQAADPNIMLEENASAEAIFEHIIRVLADALRSKKNPLHSRAKNLVKLSLLWLIRRRSLDPLNAVYALSEVSNKRALRETPRSEAQKFLLRAKPSQWQVLSVIAKLSSEKVKEADQTRDQVLKLQDQLQRRVASLEGELESKQQETATLSGELRRLETELAVGKSALEAQRQLRELDVAEAAARTKNLLAGRLSLLLSDARDALDFKPPHIEAARQRIDAARETIAREVNDSND